MPTKVKNLYLRDKSTMSISRIQDSIVRYNNIIPQIAVTKSIPLDMIPTSEQTNTALWTRVVEDLIKPLFRSTRTFEDFCAVHSIIHSGIFHADRTFLNESKEKFAAVGVPLLSVNLGDEHSREHLTIIFDSRAINPLKLSNALQNSCHIIGTANQRLYSTTDQSLLDTVQTTGRDDRKNLNEIDDVKEQIKPSLQDIKDRTHLAIFRIISKRSYGSSNILNDLLSAINGTRSSMAANRSDFSNPTLSPFDVQRQCTIHEDESECGNDPTCTYTSRGCIRKRGYMDIKMYRTATGEWVSAQNIKDQCSVLKKSECDSDPACDWLGASRRCARVSGSMRKAQFSGPFEPEEGWPKDEVDLDVDVDVKTSRPRMKLSALDVEQQCTTHRTKRECEKDGLACNWTPSRKCIRKWGTVDDKMYKNSSNTWLSAQQIKDRCSSLNKTKCATDPACDWRGDRGCTRLNGEYDEPYYSGPFKFPGGSTLSTKSKPADDDEDDDEPSIPRRPRKKLSAYDVERQCTIHQRKIDCKNDPTCVSTSRGCIRKWGSMDEKMYKDESGDWISAQGVKDRCSSLGKRACATDSSCNWRGDRRCVRVDGDYENPLYSGPYDV